MIIHGDSIQRMKLLPENSVDAIVTDPPYGIGFMGKEWDNFKPSYIKESLEKDGREKTRIASTRPSNAAGTYDTSISGSKKFQIWCEEWSREALRVLKPGGFMLVSCSTRMYHRMTCGIEDAGFQIRDTIMWIYGSGFPKSLNIGKQVDKIHGNEREIVGEKIRGDVEKAKQSGATFAAADANKNNKDIFGYGKEILTKGNSEWEGWGTALKPACEPIVVARKPLSEKNVALNVLKWGTGGINIDECRVEFSENDDKRIGKGYIHNAKAGLEIGNAKNNKSGETQKLHNNLGRFPANIILDDEAGKILDEQSGNLKSGTMTLNHKAKIKEKGIYGEIGTDRIKEYNGSSGGASRFFYCAKASKSERNFGCEELDETNVDYGERMGQNNSKVRPDGTERKSNIQKNNHPTVKPIKLMEYLVKLVSKEGATVLDPFLGSGTTAIACIKLKRKWIGIEREEDYIKIIHARIKPFMEQSSPNLKSKNNSQQGINRGNADGTMRSNTNSASSVSSGDKEEIHRRIESVSESPADTYNLNKTKGSEDVL